MLDGKYILKDRKSAQPTDYRSKSNGREIVGDLDLCYSDNVGSQSDDDEGADTGHLCDRGRCQNRSKKTRTEDQKSLKA